MCESLKDWYNVMDRTVHNKDQEILRMTKALESLKHGLKAAEDSATAWRVKYLNIEANHLNLKKNLATGRGSHVITPVHDLIPPPPDVRENCLNGRDVIACVTRANERRPKDSPYNQPFQPAFITELFPREASLLGRKKSESKRSESKASSSALINSREPLPKVRDKKSRRKLKASLQQAYGLLKAEVVDRTTYRDEVSRKTYTTLPSIPSKRKSKYNIHTK